MTLASHVECATSLMNMASNNLSISTSFLATHSETECRSFWIIGLTAGSKCNLWQAILRLISGMLEGDRVKMYLV